MAEMQEVQRAFGSDSMRREKRAVARNSVLAAFVITALKIVVGLATQSLGILSEAAHSGLDFIAALVTFFSVRVSDLPADADHQYGHGKVESFSAFIETGLLLLTCVWIVYEAVKRLFFHSVDIEPDLDRVCRDVSVDGDRYVAIAGAWKHGEQNMTARRWKRTRCIFRPTFGRAA